MAPLEQDGATGPQLSYLHKLLRSFRKQMDAPITLESWLGEGVAGTPPARKQVCNQPRGQVPSPARVLPHILDPPVIKH